MRKKLISLVISAAMALGCLSVMPVQAEDMSAASSTASTSAAASSSSADDSSAVVTAVPAVTTLTAAAADTYATTMMTAATQPVVTTTKGTTTTVTRDEPINVTKYTSTAVSAQTVNTATTTVTTTRVYTNIEDTTGEVVISEGITHLSIGSAETVDAIGSLSFQKILLPSTVCYIANKYIGMASQQLYIFDYIGGTAPNIENYIIKYNAAPLNNSTSLTEINVAEGNVTFKSVDGVLYTADMKTLLQYPAGKTDTSFDMPDEVVEIGYKAFAGCTNITDITLSDNMLNLDYTVFMDTAWYASQPDGVLYIGTAAVGYKGERAEGEEIVLRDDTTAVYAGVFPKDITSVDLPDSLRIIGNNAFQNCTGLTELVIPDGVTQIGQEAFRGCTSLVSVSLPDTLTRIYPCAFRNCTSLTNVVIPESVEIIDAYAFDGCHHIDSMTFLNPDVIISDHSFTFSTNTIIVADQNSNADQYAQKYGRYYRILTGSEPEYDTGDIDGDGVITMSDATNVLSIYAKRAAALEVTEFTEAQLAAADVIPDGTISISDAAAILSYYAQDAALLDPKWEDIIGAQ